MRRLASRAVRRLAKPKDATNEPPRSVHSRRIVFPVRSTGRLERIARLHPCPLIPAGCNLGKRAAGILFPFLRRPSCNSRRGVQDRRGRFPPWWKRDPSRERPMAFHPSGRIWSVLRRPRRFRRVRKACVHQRISLRITGGKPARSGSAVGSSLSHNQTKGKIQHATSRENQHL